MSAAEKKMSIPSANQGTLQNTQEAQRFLEAVKQNVDVITGRAHGTTEIDTIPQGATLVTVIARINQIITRINSSGT